MKDTLVRTILGPVIPDYAGKEAGQTAMALALMKAKGSQSSEPGEGESPISENPTNDPQPT